MPYANNKGADQPAHPRNRISTFVFLCLDSFICIFAISQVSRFKLVPVAEQAGLNLSWSKIPKDTFSRDVAQMLLTVMTFETSQIISWLKLCLCRDIIKLCWS